MSRVAVPCALAVFVAAAGCGPRPSTGAGGAPAGARDQVPPPPYVTDTLPAGPKTFGPLSLAGKVPETSWSLRKQQMRANDARKIDRAGIRADVAAFESIVDTFYVPHTREQQEFVRYAHEHDKLLERLAPYSVASLAGAFRSAGQRLELCVRPPNEMWHCDPSAPIKPPPHKSPYTIGGTTPDIAVWRINDLSNAADPGWGGLPKSLALLASSRAIVLDMRHASGGDPRALVPWLEEVTGRVPLRPLREIRRPAIADAYVAAYEARFVAEGRDPALWRPLVGTMPAAGTRGWTQPIAIVIGPHCESACELVTRVLETYADAIVLGDARRFGRLVRDEPALATLPSSKVDVYFHATEYLLAPEIEARTGPTHAWRAIGGDPDDDTLVPAAVRELELRLANPSGWPARCDAITPYATQAAMPAAAHSKISSEQLLDRTFCPDGHHIDVYTSLPLTTLRRFLATCSRPLEVTRWFAGQYSLGQLTRGDYRVLSQVAQSELIDRILIECEHRAEPN